MPETEARDAEPPRRGWQQAWLYDGPGATGDVDLDDRHRRPPDLFARVRAARWLVVRLVVEGLAIVVGACLLAGIGVSAPLLGAGMIAVGLIAGIVDLVLLRRLRRGTAEAWVDLSLPPDGRE